MLGRMLTLCKRIVTRRPRLRQTIISNGKLAGKRYTNVTLQAVELFHHLILLFIITLDTTEVSASRTCMFLSIVGVLTG